MNEPIVLGVDMGSREVKIIATKGPERLIEKKISTMQFYKNYCRYEEKLIFDTQAIMDQKPDYCISTGYGRNNVHLENFDPILEIKAHVYGAMYQTKLKDFTLLDIGGQDVKVIQVDNGMITDMALNDKCAASCGRYLENMSRVLEISLEELSSHWQDPIPLSSTCAVFSESELIGKIAEGVSMERLCAGVNYSMVQKIMPLLRSMKQDVLLISGGVANNQAIVSLLKESFKTVEVLREAQYNGAIGCCYYGGIMRKKEK